MCFTLAHKRLFDSEPHIIHRDISVNNILLGREDAGEGERGVIIDFDLAVRLLKDRPSLKADYRIVSLCHSYLSPC